MAALQCLLMVGIWLCIDLLVGVIFAITIPIALYSGNFNAAYVVPMVLGLVLAFVVPFLAVTAITFKKIGCDDDMNNTKKSFTVGVAVFGIISILLAAVVGATVLGAGMQGSWFYNSISIAQDIRVDDVTTIIDTKYTAFTFTGQNQYDASKIYSIQESSYDDDSNSYTYYYYYVTPIVQQGSSGTVITLWSANKFSSSYEYEVLRTHVPLFFENVGVRPNPDEANLYLTAAIQGCQVYNCSTNSVANMIVRPKDPYDKRQYYGNLQLAGIILSAVFAGTAILIQIASLFLLL
jgi:hypothetical protein